MNPKLRKILIKMSKICIYGIIVQLSIFTFAFALEGEAQKKSVNDIHVSIELGNPVRLDILIESLEKTTDFSFSHIKQEVNPSSHEVSLESQEYMLGDLLRAIASQTDLSFHRVNNYIQIRKKMQGEAPVMESLSQDTPVSGKVVDEFGEPLPGATIIIKGTTTGTVTDLDGLFELTASPGNVIVVTFVGYQPQEFTIGVNTEFTIALKPDISSLEEIVVVGYGTQRKSDLTGSVASVGEERLNLVPNVNFTQALRSAVPGILIDQNSAGAEGGDVEITIRGRNSINGDNKPFIVLDGIPYSGDISDINPSDIKSISVLKDASSVAIYGTRGSNGVILIQTKRGNNGKASINYSGFYGVTDIVNYLKPLTGAQFAEFKEEREPGTMTVSELEILNSTGGVDWIDLATQTGIKQQHTVSISGGTAETKYFVSGTYLDVKGIAVNDEFKRYSLRVNLDQDITSWLSFGTSTQLSLSDRSGRPAQFSGEQGAYTMNPLTKAFNEDGSYTIFPWAEDPFFYNPLNQTLAIDDDVTNKVFTNNFIDVQLPFIPGLSYRLNTGVEYYSWEQGTYFGRNTSRGVANGGEADVRNRVGENYTVENIINYDKTFKKHSLKFTGLYSFQQQKFEDRRLRSSGFTSDLLSYYQASQGTVITPSSAVTESVILSSMARINYGFDGRYLFTFTGRRDGYSAFGENTKYGFFPSAAVAWNIHNETFFTPIEAIFSSLKLRISYGKSGNQAVPAYETLSKYGERNYVFGESTSAGFFPTTLGAPDLGWETNTALNVGIDFGLFKDRFQSTIDFYRADISDLLFPLQIPSIYGPTEITSNAAKVRNTGVEFSFTSYNVDRGAFSWTTDFNTSYNKNEVIDLPGGIDDVTSRLFIGRPITQNFGLRFDGIWQEGDDFLSSAQPDAYPGDVKVADVGGGPTGGPNGQIDVDQDRTFQGQRDPKIIWGMNNSFSYGNFSLAVFMHGVHGATRIFDVEPNVYTGVRRNTIHRDYWSEASPSSEFPANRVSIEGVNNYPGVNPYSVFNYVSADFIRVKDITLAYNFPASMLSKLGLSNLKVYVNTRNLLTFTRYPGLDPELSSQDEIPLQREFILGLNVGL